MDKELQVLMVECALLRAHAHTMEDAFLGMYKEQLPEEQYKALAANFYERLHDRSVRFLDKFADVLPPAVIQKEKFELFSYRNARLRDLGIETS